ncbi:MAG: hypothetical protein ABIH20_04585 [Candidatus Diapherotrites archaeon]
MPPKKKSVKKQGFLPGIDPTWARREDAHLRKELQRVFGKKKKK